MKTITLDATDKPLGRLASETAICLRGKNSPAFAPHKMPDVIVEIQNIQKVKVTGKKLNQKKYYRYSGYSGGLKTEALSDRLEKNPKEAFRKTVRLMLPDNKLRDKILKHIKFL